VDSVAPVTAAVLGIDIEKFSSRDMDIQRELQRDLAEAFTYACRHIGLSISPACHQDTGDGSMNVITQDVDLAVLVSDLPRELAISLGSRNRTRTPEGRLRLRVALAYGPVGLGEAWQGSTVVEAARLLDCRAGRAALEAAGHASLVLLISDRVFEEAVRPCRRGLAPEDFTRAEIGGERAEKGEGIIAWACVYERDRPHAASLPAQAEASRDSAPAPAPSVVRVGRIKGPTAIGPGGTAVGRDHVQGDARRREVRDE
jgi:hypothetical protein